jgi:hypothetical protein
MDHDAVVAARVAALQALYDAVHAMQDSGMSEDTALAVVKGVFGS